MFYYFGSKARIAKYYPQPLSEVVVEPFAGSAGYSCLHRTKNVILVERDPRVVDLWRRLVGMSTDEILNIPPPTVGVPSSDLLVMLRAASEHSLTSRYITVTERMASRWPHLLRRVAEMVPNIQHWEIIEGDYTDAPDIKATWFIDPPYQNIERGYAYRDIDYGELAMWCRSRKGQVIVCEQAGASWLPFNRLRDIRTTNRSLKTEVVWEFCGF